MFFRCRFKDLEDESKELKEKLAEVEGLLKQAEAQRQELERKNLIADHALSEAVRRACKVTSLLIFYLKFELTSENANVFGVSVNNKQCLFVVYNARNLKEIRSC